MKNSFFFLLFIGLTGLVNAQEFPMNDQGKIVYEEVVKIEGATKDQLYKQARSWFKESYRQSDQDDDVIYLSDSYLGELGANPYMWMEVKSVGNKLTAGAVLYDIKFEAKEGRYKYTITNPYHEAQRSKLGAGGALENKEPDCGVLNMQQKYWDEIKMTAHENFTAMINSLKASMTQTISNAKGKEDW